MPLNAFELVELRTLERGDLVGSDGHDWLRCLVGVAVTIAIVLSMIGIGYKNVMVVLAIALMGCFLTAHWTVMSGRKVVKERIAFLLAKSKE